MVDNWLERAEHQLVIALLDAVAETDACGP